MKIIYKLFCLGRAHRQMLDSLEDSIHCIVDILREHMRVAEEKKVIELQRLQRLNKKGGRGREPESHCNMCDMKFMGKIVTHRKYVSCIYQFHLLLLCI